MNTDSIQPDPSRGFRLRPWADHFRWRARAAAGAGGLARHVWLNSLPPRALVRLASVVALLLAGDLIAGEPPKPPDLPAVVPEATNAAPPGASPTSSLVSAATANAIVAVSTNSMDGLDATYRLGIGDRLSFRIVEDEEDPKPLFLTDSGEVEVPYLGRFPAVERSCKELAYALKAELEKKYYYQATVLIAVDLMAKKSRGRVYFVGSIRAPGPLEIPSDEILTLSKAILRVGGFSEFADKRHVTVTRPAAQTGQADQAYTIDVAQILEKGNRANDLVLEAGDLIYVPQRLFNF